jgi:hypothetical protein
VLDNIFAASFTEISAAVTAGTNAADQLTILVDNGAGPFGYTDQDVNASPGDSSYMILQSTLINITVATAVATNDFYRRK